MISAPKRKAKRRKKAPRVPKANGRPAFAPTEDQRNEVRTLASVGYPEDGIASYVGIDAKTLRKYFGVDIDKAKPRLLGSAFGVIAHHLKNQDLGAAKYVLSTQGKRQGWTERTEHTGADGEKLFGNADPSKLSDKNFALLMDLLAAMGVEVPGGPASLGR